MKKTYIQPLLYMQAVQPTALIALSLFDDEADPDGEVLVKGDAGKDAWSSPKNVWDDDWSK